MKRNEMILKIQLDRSCEIEEAESILNMIEKLGMLPPDYLAPPDFPDGYYPNGRPVHGEWESE